jgi:hypothetical protein
MNRFNTSKLSLVSGLLFAVIIPTTAANVAHADRGDRPSWRSKLDQTTLSPAHPLTIAQTPLSTPQPTSSSQKIWGCRAESSTRIYVVDQLNDAENSFDVAIYEKSRGDEGDYIGTTQVNVTRKTPDLVGSGQTYNSTLEVNALGRTAAFAVRDSVAGQASGRCSVQWQMADSATRQQVRQCLALVARQSNTVPETARFGCTANPSSYIEELQRR